MERIIEIITGALRVTFFSGNFAGEYRTMIFFTIVFGIGFTVGYRRVPWLCYFCSIPLMVHGVCSNISNNTLGIDWPLMLFVLCSSVMGLVVLLIGIKFGIIVGYFRALKILSGVCCEKEAEGEKIVASLYHLTASQLDHLYKFLYYNIYDGGFWRVHGMKKFVRFKSREALNKNVSIEWDFYPLHQRESECQKLFLSSSIFHNRMGSELVQGPGFGICVKV